MGHPGEARRGPPINAQRHTMSNLIDHNRGGHVTATERALHNRRSDMTALINVCTYVLTVLRDGVNMEGFGQPLEGPDYRPNARNTTNIVDERCEQICAQMEHWVRVELEVWFMNSVDDAVDDMRRTLDDDPFTGRCWEWFADVAMGPALESSRCTLDDTWVFCGGQAVRGTNGVPYLDRVGGKEAVLDAIMTRLEVDGLLGRFRTLVRLEAARAGGSVQLDHK
jgi:hypothetical protein